MYLLSIVVGFYDLVTLWPQGWRSPRLANRAFLEAFGSQYSLLIFLVDRSGPGLLYELYVRNEWRSLG